MMGVLDDPRDVTVYAAVSHRGRVLAMFRSELVAHNYCVNHLHHAKVKAVQMPAEYWRNDE